MLCSVEDVVPTIIFKRSSLLQYEGFSRTRQATQVQVSATVATYYQPELLLLLNAPRTRYDTNEGFRRCNNSVLKSKKEV